MIGNTLGSDDLCKQYTDPYRLWLKISCTKSNMYIRYKINCKKSNKNYKMYASNNVINWQIYECTEIFYELDFQNFH